MIRVRIKSPVVVGHKRRLPGEIHEVSSGVLRAAIARYGKAAFEVLDGEVPTPAEAPPPNEDDHSGSKAEDGQATDPPAILTEKSDQTESSPAVAEPEQPTADRAEEPATPTSSRKGKK